MEMIPIAKSPIKAAYDRDLARLKWRTNRKYSAGTAMLIKPANGHHLNGTGSLTRANSVPQWLQRTVYAVPRKKYLEQTLIET